MTTNILTRAGDLRVRSLRGFGGQQFLPGRPSETVSALLEAEELPTPTEIVEWFGWHDGSSTTDSEAVLAPSRFEPYSLNAAFAERRWRLAAALKAAADFEERNTSEHALTSSGRGHGYRSDATQAAAS